MDSDVANRYFQGEENVALAIAGRRIKASGNVKKALARVPITKPLFPLYRELLEEHYPYLVARTAVVIVMRSTVFGAPHVHYPDDVRQARPNGLLEPRVRSRATRSEPEGDR